MLTIMKSYTSQLYFTVLMLIILSVHSGFAINYYVDSQNGSDSNNGKTQLTAWKTITKVSSIYFSGGDSVLFMRGLVFRGTLIPSGGSSASSLVTYGAYGDISIAKP
ncbi:MAG: hypothetical protein ACOYMD_11625, partial [Paludibacter sp.]